MEYDQLYDSIDDVEYGKTHIVYGRGKGKTTSTVGTVVRASHYGLNIKYVQFMKKSGTGESEFLKEVNNVDYVCHDYDSLVHPEKGMTEEQMEKAKKSFYEIQEINKDYDFLVCDEILNLPIFTLNNEKGFRIDYKDIEKIIDNKRDSLEMILTGMYAPESLIKKADYVSEIKKVKHPYEEGLVARPGVEF